MDDSCAVCADNLEWVAYGSCGHREVCSTCVARLRFICGDRRCCICKTEATVVFVTKAMGDYTRMINDFSVFPSEVREGRVGPYWYHEDTEAFFDDPDHYKMIKAMCRLSCSECDKIEDQSSEGSKRRGKFRNIEQLKGHLFHRHRLLMCSLCLEGRKVFICEQKLYTRAQLNQHISSGDSEVDGSESERGGFTGHPTCEFCRTPFYGDNELYSHMSTEHYTCHICQRQHPGQYEYYKNYDDLEIHFRRDHFLCEDESCLAKKFIVLQSEAELKRHNAIEHGGRMSRAKRNEALQIPTSFRYRRAAEENRRGKGRSFQREHSDYQLSAAIQASLETAMDPLPSTSSSQVIPDHEEIDNANPLVQSFEELSTVDSESSLRYLQALGPSSRGSALVESSFPPLPMVPSSSQQKPKNKNPIVAQSWGQNSKNKNILSNGQAWPPPSGRSVQPSASAIQSRPAVNSAVLTSQTPVSTSALPSYASSAQVRPWSQHQPVAADGLVSSSSAKTSRKKSGIKHSASDPNLAETGLAESSSSDFPPISATQVRKLPVNNHALVKVEDVQTANKSLVEKIRSALRHDEEKYATFRDLSGQYRQGLIDTEKYLDYVRQHGLSHLVIELARLLPDPQKQRELVETYNSSLRNNELQENGGVSAFRLKDISGSRKAKGKSSYVESLTSKDVLADNILSSVRKLQSGYKHSEEEVEVLSKDGYRVSKGKSKLMVDEQPMEICSGGEALVRLGLQNDPQTIENGSGDGVGGGGGSSKHRKKTSKFHRARLGDGSMAALLDLKNSEPETVPESKDKKSDEDQNSMEQQLPVRGAWRKGGQKLFP